MEVQRGAPRAAGQVPQAAAEDAMLRLRKAIIELGDQYARFSLIREQAQRAFSEIARVKADIAEHEVRFKAALSAVLKVADEILIAR